MPSISLAIPVSLKDSANQIAEVLGYGRYTFTVALSSNGKPPVTHYGARTDGSDTFVEWLNQATNGNYPAIDGIDSFVVQQVFDSLIVDVSNDLWGIDHFQSMLETEGLKIIRL
jgi:hypothetical protein